MKNIVLVGMMGAGKTTVGELLATKLNRELKDIDRVIEQEQKKSIIEIFTNDGEEAFRQLESETIEKFSNMSNLIISTGGGALEKANNLSNLQKNGIIIYLKADIEELFKRVKNETQRPLLKEQDPLEVIKKLIKKREKFYLMANITIITDNKSPEKITEEIIKAIKNYE
mgnify:FL=1